MHPPPQSTACHRAGSHPEPQPEHPSLLQGRARPPKLQSQFLRATPGKAGYRTVQIWEPQHSRPSPRTQLPKLSPCTSPQPDRGTKPARPPRSSAQKRAHHRPRAAVPPAPQEPGRPEGQQFLPEDCRQKPRPREPRTEKRTRETTTPIPGNYAYSSSMRKGLGWTVRAVSWLGELGLFQPGFRNRPSQVSTQ